MSARQTNGQTEFGVLPEVCTATVTYSDVSARNLAMRFCERLARDFEGDLDFDFTWWNFRYLTDPGIAREAAEAAASSDLVIVSLHGTEEFPSEVAAWFDLWPAQRRHAEGALVLVHPMDLAVPVSRHGPYLRSLAERANLDYLTIPAPALPPFTASAPPSLPTFLGEAQLLDDRYHSTGWGINE